MGIDLRTQVLQLHLRTCCLYLKTGFLVMLDTSGKDNGRSHCCRHRQAEDVTHDEEECVDGCLPEGRPYVDWHKQTVGKSHPVMQEDTKHHHHDEVNQHIVPSLSYHETLRCKPEVIDVEHHHHKEWRHTVHHVVQPGHSVAT